MKAVLNGARVQRAASSWFKHFSSIGVVAAAVLMASQSQQAQAVDTDPTPVTNYFEQGLLMRSGETVGALGPNLMGDSINDYSGALEFSQTDVSLPGNNALPVAVGRRLVTGSKHLPNPTGAFGDWDLEIPRLHAVAMQDGVWYGNGPISVNLNRCSQLRPPPQTSVYGGSKMYTVTGYKYWDGYHLYVPGSGDQTMVSRDSGNGTAGPNQIQPTDGLTYPVVTKQHWQFSCLPTLERGSGEGFVAHAPDGTVYQFDHMVSRLHPGLKVALGATLQRTEVWILPTQITDRFGNWVRYSYGGSDGRQVNSITSSDGRSITMTWSGTHVSSMSDGTRTWTYSYDGNGRLQTVTLPDSSQWQFSLSLLELDPLSSPDPDCSGDDPLWDGNTRSGTITHPSGAVGTFNLKMTMHGRSNVPGTQATCSTALASRYFTIYSLVSKNLSGPGMPSMTWGYGYSEAIGSYAPCNGCTNTKTVAITDPNNNVTIKTFGTQFGINDGLLLNSYEGWNGSAGLRYTSYNYAASNAGPYPATVGYNGAYADSMSVIFTPQNQRVITQQGVTFTQTVNGTGSGFDIYARPLGVIRSNTLGYSRTESTTYSDHTGKWILGQVAAQTIAGLQASSTTFDLNTALPTASYKFGKPHATYGFNADGTIASVTDGLNQSTTLSNYMRGIPQHIGFADGNSVNGVVTNIGVLSSVTNEAGTTSTYTYDAMGRLASKTPPGGDAVGYNPTTLSFVQVPNAEYGIDANHWRQTITTGNAVTVNYFDARWRKRLTRTYDAGDPANTQRMQRFDYDPYNRTSFASYPVRSIGSVSDSVAGTATGYDALGRPFQTVADSELGALTTTIQYLANFQKQVTNPRGFATTTAYQVFDEPSESAISAMAAPEGVSVVIGRDIFDKPLSITRSGTYVGASVSATRSYVYDGNQLLCKTIEPEIGATVQSLDAANNVSARATGLNLPSLSSCDYGSVPSAKVVAYSYDARNRVTGTGFGDGSPAIGRSYTADGLPWTVVSNGSTWTYGYNNRRLLTSESLVYSGSTYGIGRAYDGNGNLSQLTYPGGASLAYAPNALGEATQAGSYATGVAYHPNGQVAGYTLGNGTVHATSQNVRGLPLVNSDSGVLQDQYAYDANGNIASISDQQEGISSRAMGYDGLDRLTVANSPNVWGSGSYSYDPIDNIRTSVVGSRSSVHSYLNNRLDTITTNGTVTAYAYDSQGNITARGSQGYYFDQGNRMQLANGKASYTYDGLGRRVTVSAADGSSQVQVYSQAGQLLYGVQQGTSTAQSTRYIYLGGKVIAQVGSSSGATYLYTDALGSPVATKGPVAATVLYSCASGWTLSGTTCSQGTTSSVAATVTGYSCPSGYTLSGSTCSLTTDATSAATANYSCSSGWTLSGTNCTLTTTTAATPVYSCPSGYSLSGSTCSGTTTYTATSSLSCNGYGSLQTTSLSPTGYMCLAQTILNASYDSPYEECQNRAATMGLVLVNTTVPASGKTQCVIGPKTVYSCPSGGTLSGTTCTASATQAASISSYTCSSGTVSGSSCVSTSTAAASVSYSCPSGQTLSGTTCHAYSTSNVAGTPSYSCPSGYTLSGATCTQQGVATAPATPSFGCTSGTLSGFYCLDALTRTRYEPYGKTAAGTVPTGIGFTGHVNDADTGLVYMQQRYYDPIAARFLSVDPIATDGDTGSGFNLYEYANNNPYRYTDPDGRDSWSQEPTTTVIKQPVTGSNISQTTTIKSYPGPNGKTTVTTSGPLGSGSGTLNARPLTGSGHHEIPNQTVKTLGITSPAALEVFDSQVARIPVEDHNGARPGSNTVNHDEYNRLATKEASQFMQANRINPTTMTAEQAKAMVNHFKTEANMEIRQFNQVQYSRALQQAIQRAWYRAPVKTEE